MSNIPRIKVKKVAKIVLCSLLWLESNKDNKELIKELSGRVSLEKRGSNLHVETRLDNLLKLVGLYLKNKQREVSDNGTNLIYGTEYGLPLEYVGNLEKDDLRVALNQLRDFDFFEEKKKESLVHGSKTWKFTIKFERGDIGKNLKQFFGTDTGSDSCQWDVQEAISKGTSIFPVVRVERHQLPKDYCNLPLEEQGEIYIGRSDELGELLKKLSLEHRPHVIVVNGIGGVGKTALAVEAAWRCWEAKYNDFASNLPSYDAIVFVSFKEEELIVPGEVSLSQSDRLSQSKLRQVFRTISTVLDDGSITRITDDIEEQKPRVIKALSSKRCLLILADFQSMTSKEEKEIWDFLDKLPYPMKCILTTSKEVKNRCVSLNPLGEEDSLQLIEQQSSQSKTQIDRIDAQKLYACYGGIPLALALCVGRIHEGYSVNELINDCHSYKPNNPHWDAAYFCFSCSIKSIEQDPSYSLLLAISVFCHSPKETAALMVAGLDASSTAEKADCWGKLKGLCLIEEVEGRYKMNSLIREYTRDVLSENSRLEKEVLDRWAEYYQNFAKSKGGTDWEDWQTQYNNLESEWENFLSVLDWYAKSENYEAVKKLWGCLNRFSDLYGHWDDRLYWLNWLIDRSKERGEHSTQASALSGKGWTLTMKGQPDNLEEAEEIFEQAWLLKDDMEPIARDHLILNIVVLLIRQGRYDEARVRLAEKKENYHLIESSEVDDEKTVRRCWLNTQRSYAEISFREGKENLDEASLNEARKLYEEFRKGADEIKWTRGLCYALNQLADIAIEQEDWVGAKGYLDKGRPIAERNENKRRLAFYDKSQALLDIAQGDTHAAKLCLMDVKKRFIRLGMLQEAEEVESLLSKLVVE